MPSPNSPFACWSMNKLRMGAYGLLPRQRQRRIYNRNCVGTNIVDSPSRSGDDSLAPWLLDRFRLWSLYEMLKFYAAGYTVAMVEFAKAIAILTYAEQSALDTSRRNLAESFNVLVENMAEVPLSVAFMGQLRSLRDRIAKLTWEDRENVLTLAVSLQNHLILDLATHQFLLVPAERSQFYQQPTPPFGEAVADRFPGATYDIAAASRCIALDEWTAAVFHLMRVHELALRDLGRRLKITVAKNKTIDFQDWQVIIDGVQKAVKTTPTGSRAGARTARKREFYSEVAQYLFHIKEVWRVPIVHARANSDDRQAMNIWDNTEALMRLLARKSP
jgi:hypothetical protein